MVQLSTCALALLALAASATAAPTTDATSVTHFTFSQWIEGIIADPHGDHLSPEEAVAAKQAAEAAANPLLKKRMTCGAVAHYVQGDNGWTYVRPPLLHCSIYTMTLYSHHSRLLMLQPAQIISPELEPAGFSVVWDLINIPFRCAILELQGFGVQRRLLQPSETV